MIPRFRRTALRAACPLLLAQAALSQEAPLPALVEATTIQVSLPGLEDVPVAQTDKKIRPGIASPAKPAAEPLPEARVDGGKFVDERYAVQAPQQWWGPLTLASGVRYAKPDTSASFSINFHKSAQGIYKNPTAYRAHMRSKGTINDTHGLDTVKFAERWASRARYRSVVYGAKKLYTDVRKIYYVEEILIPDPDGIYVLQFKAEEEDFKKYRSDYLYFLKNLSIAKLKKYEPAEFYEKRKDQAADLFEETADILDITIGPRDSYIETKFQAGFQLGMPVISPKAEGVSPRPKRGAGGRLQFLFHPVDWIGVGPEITLQQYFKEKRGANVPGVREISTKGKTNITSLIAKIYPSGKQKYSPYLLVGVGQHATKFDVSAEGPAAAGCTDLEGLLLCDGGASASAKGLALSAALGLERRYGEMWSLSAEARYQRLELSGGGMSASASSFSYHLGSHWHFGKYHFADDPVHIKRAYPKRLRRSRPKEETRTVALPGFDEEKTAPKSDFFSHKIPLGWKGPVNIPGGHRCAAPGGEASFSIAYIFKNETEWMPPEAFRAEMRRKGTISDTHVLDTLQIGRRFASRARYTSHFYRDSKLLGGHRDSYYTEEIYVPERRGHYLITYRGRPEAFDEHYRGYLAFLKSLSLKENPGYRPEIYYTQRDHILVDLIETGVSAKREKRIKRRILFDKRLQAGMALNWPGGFGFQFMYSLYDNVAAGLHFGMASLGGDVKTKAVGARARYHLKDTMSNGPYAFFDVSYVSAPFEPILAADETIIESKSAVLAPAVGIGYLHLWDFFYVDGGWGWGPTQTLKRCVVATPPASGEAALSKSVRGMLYLGGGIRF